MDGDAFPNHVVVADAQAGGLAAVGERRRVLPHRGELEDAVALADFRGALDDGVGADAAVVANGHARADVTPRPNFHTRAEFRANVHDGAWIDHSFRSRSAQRISVVQATSPATIATPRNFITERRSLNISISMSSRSPGITGRLKRVRSVPAK